MTFEDKCDEVMEKLKKNPGPSLEEKQEKIIEELKAENTRLKKKVNYWDSEDVVRQISLLKAAGLQIAAYRIRNLETNEFGPIQFHMTYNNLVMGIMSEDSAKAFSSFVNDTLNPSLGPR